MVDDCNKSQPTTKEQLSHQLWLCPLWALTSRHIIPWWMLIMKQTPQNQKPQSEIEALKRLKNKVDYVSLVWILLNHSFLLFLRLCLIRSFSMFFKAPKKDNKLGQFCFYAGEFLFLIVLFWIYISLFTLLTGIS